jgi:hypothetical protein
LSTRLRDDELETLARVRCADTGADAALRLAPSPVLALALVARSVVELVPASSSSGGDGIALELAVVPVVKPGLVASAETDVEDADAVSDAGPEPAEPFMEGTAPRAAAHGGTAAVWAARRGSMVMAPAERAGLDSSSSGDGGNVGEDAMSERGSAVARMARPGVSTPR